MTKRKSKSPKSIVKATAAKTSVTKSSAATPVTFPLIVLGYDEQQKPRGARFVDAKPDLVTKAADLLGFKVYEATPPDVAEAAKKLPLGRLYANGRGFVPNIRQSLYSDLVVALGLEPQAALSPETDKDSLPAARGLPRSWDEIGAGHPVIAPELDYGWWGMMTAACPIFQTFEAVKRVSVELDRLLADIVARFRTTEPHLFKDAADYEWYDCLPAEDLSWVELGGTLTIPVAVKESTRGRSKPHHLSIRFDLYREIADDEPPIWEQASEALIVIGFSPLKDNPWPNYMTVVTRDGRLRDQEAWEACRTNRYADGKLLEWAGIAQGKNWAQRGWIFALPLRSFKDPESVDKQLIQPVLRLLVKNDDPDVSLAGTAAIKWSQQPTSPPSVASHSK